MSQAQPQGPRIEVIKGPVINNDWYLLCGPVIKKPVIKAGK